MVENYICELQDEMSCKPTNSSCCA